MTLPAPEQLLRSLIEIPSTTGEEGGIGNFLGVTLGEMGFDVRKQEVAAGRNNLLATLPGHDPKILLCSHIDTVPPVIPFRETDDRIHGRGACDTKGVITAMLHGGRTLIDSGFRDFGFLLLVGEEVDHCGALKARELNMAPVACIVGEPTECRLASGQKGMYKATLHAKGVAGHSAYPESGKSAIHLLVPALNRLLDHPWPGDQTLGTSSINVGTVRGGVAANVFAPSSEATILLRLACPLAEAEAEVARLAGPGIEVKKISGNDPVRLVTLPGYESEPVAFNTDIPYLGFERNLLYGPGSIRVAHSADEFIPKTELHEAIRVYPDLARKALALS